MSSPSGAAATGSSYQIDGGTGGNDALDYRRLQRAAVSVDLAEGTATDTSGVQHIAVVTGGTGNDTLTAGTGDATLAGGPGDDLYRFDPDVKEGNFTVVENSGPGSGTDTLDFSRATVGIAVDLSRTDQQSIDAAGNLTLTLSSGDSIEGVVGGSGNDSITGNALDNTLGGGPGNDTLVGGLGDDTYVFGSNWGTDTVTEAPGQTSGEGHDTLDFSAVSANLAATVAADGSFGVTDGTDAVNTANVENLVGGTGTNSLDYSSYGSGVTVDLATGRATDFNSVHGFENVLGSPFDDLVTGDALANTLKGGGGDDTLSGGGGQDTIDGGAGVNTLVESSDSDFTLTNTALTTTPSGSSLATTETLSGIELASLTGGTDPNRIDASAFTGLTTLTPLSFLNNGRGVDTSGDPLVITLTSGKAVNVDLSHATTVSDVLTAIDAADQHLAAALNAAGTGIDLTDSSGGGGTLSASSASSLATDLGLNVSGSGGSLRRGEPRRRPRDPRAAARPPSSRC